MMVRLLALCAVLFAGCSGAVDDGSGGPQHAPPGPSVEPIPGVPSSALREVADREAMAWSDRAKLFYVAAFEGKMPDWAAESPWADPHLPSNDPPGDGRTRAWSYSYGLDTQADEAAVQANGAGVQVSRLGHVVTVAENGTILASYDTIDDDEGAPPTPYLEEGLIDSDAAGQAASQAAGYAEAAENATFTRTYLGGRFGTTQVFWQFYFDTGAFYDYHVFVDAKSGAILSDG